MAEHGHSTYDGWFGRKRRMRARRALERQLDYQEKKAASVKDSDEIGRNIFLRSQVVRQKIAAARPIANSDKVLEVGGGAHGLAFGFGNDLAVAIDPLAVDYKRLFPQWQRNAVTAAAIGEELPFDDNTFEVVLSDNVIDHAGDPLKIIDEIIRVMKPGGVLYFTVNVHHPVYEMASRAHGLWNAIGLNWELSAFADHTVHFSEQKIREVFTGRAIKAISQTSTASETKKAQRVSKAKNFDALLKKVFFKNALFEVVAIKL